MAGRYLVKGEALVRALALALGALAAAGSMPAPSRALNVNSKLFSDRMVLQSGQPVPVWGQGADAQEHVTAILSGQSGCLPSSVCATDYAAETTAGDDGAWQLQLPAMAPAGPFQLTVHGDTSGTVVRHDVMIGEVWVCAGQSNMLLGAPLLRDLKAYVGLRHPAVRWLTGGEWQAGNSPATGGNHPAKACFYFATDLSERLLASRQVINGATVGIINKAVGETGIVTWMAPSTSDADPAVTPNPAGGENYDAQIAPLLPPPCASPNGCAPAAYKGVAWWQGERDGYAPDVYVRLLPALIRSWRAHWGRPDLPFVFVQIRGGRGLTYEYKNSQFDPTYPPLDKLDNTSIVIAHMRNAYLDTLLRVPHTGMVVTTDLKGTPYPHVAGKEKYGARIARIAADLVYGLPGAPIPGVAGNYAGPTFAYQTRETCSADDPQCPAGGGNRLRIHFQRGTADGLKACTPPAPCEPGTTEARGFQLSADGDSWGPGAHPPANSTFKWASAAIDTSHETVLVWDGDQPATIVTPNAARYAWDYLPQRWANLFNGDNLGAGPFSTDLTPSPTPTPAATPTPTP